MARAARAIGIGSLVVLLAAGGYGVADAHDVVPGVLTLDPVPPDPRPFPEAPGAVEPPDLADALPALDAAAPVPDAGQVSALVGQLVTDTRMGPSVGVVVADQLTGEVLAEHDAAAAKTPASTAKLL